MRVFSKKPTNRGRKISSEVFGYDDESVRTVQPTEAEEFSLSSNSEEEKPESTSTARNPRVAKKRKSLEASSKKNTFDTSDSEDKQASDDSDYSTKKKKKKKKVTKKKRNSRTSQQSEDNDDEFDKKAEEYLNKANKFFEEVDSTKLSKTDIKEEEQLLLKHATKEIQERAEKEQKAVEDARLLIQKAQKSKELQREILEGTQRPTETSLTEEERQKEATLREEREKEEAKRQEYARYCRSVDGIVEPMPYEEYVARGDIIIPASEATELDDLDFV